MPPVDWKRLREVWAEVPEEFKAKLREAFKKKTREELAKLFDVDPNARFIYELVTGEAWIPIRIPPPPPPPPAIPPVLPKEWLWDKFSAILRSRDLDPEKYRERFEEEYPGIAGLSREDQQRVIELLAREIVREAVPPPKPPPRPPAPPVAPPPVRVRVEEIREPEIVSRTCIVGGEEFDIDLDLVRRVTESGVVMRPRGVTAFQGPLLTFPERFYHMCPRHRYEKFGYYDIYHALAYQVWEARRTDYRRLKLTIDGLKAMGFNPDDIRAIEEWIARMPRYRKY
jgi:hypothetical protein